MEMKEQNKNVNPLAQDPEALKKPTEALTDEDLEQASGGWYVKMGEESIALHQLRGER